MLSCKQVATQASDYLDQEAGGTLRWQMHLHLMMCSRCRRFLRHLRITRQLATGQVAQEKDRVDAESILKIVQQRAQKRNSEASKNPETKT